MLCSVNNSSRDRRTALPLVPLPVLLLTFCAAIRNAPTLSALLHAHYLLACGTSSTLGHHAGKRCASTPQQPVDVLPHIIEVYTSNMLALI